MQEELERILAVMCRCLPMASDVRLKEVAEKCCGFTGADLKALLYNAQLMVAHETLDRTRPAATHQGAANTAERAREDQSGLAAMKEEGEDGEEEGEGGEEEEGEEPEVELEQTLTVPGTRSSPSSPKKGKVLSGPPSPHGHNQRHLPKRSISEPFGSSSCNARPSRTTQNSLHGGPSCFVSRARSSSVFAAGLWQPQVERKVGWPSDWCMGLCTAVANGCDLNCA